MPQPIRKLKEWSPDIKNYWWSKLCSKKKFQEVESYCMFLGYTRSGHSLIGAILDAHPNIVIAHELNALHFWKENYSANQIFHLILKRAEAFKKIKAEWTGYSYNINGLWQGSHDGIKIIGDKRGAGSLKVLKKSPDLLNIIQEKVPKLKIIHVVRSPFDMLATQTIKTANRNDTTPSLPVLKMKMTHLIQKLDQMEALITQNDYEIKTIHHEKFVLQPKVILKELLHFLEISYSQDYLDRSTAIVLDQPIKSRHKLKLWTPDLIDWVGKQIAPYSFLKHYRFDD